MDNLKQSLLPSVTKNGTLAVLREPSLVLLKPREFPLQSELGDFLIDRQSQELSPRTVKLYQSEIGYFLEYARAQAIAGLLDISPDLLRRWLLELGKTRNPGGLHVNYRTLKTWLLWCWQEYEIDAPCPIAKVRPPKLPQEVLEPVSMDDLRLMLDTCDKTLTGLRDKAVLLCLLDSGLRASEFVSLDIGDVNPATGTVLVRHGKGDKGRMTFIGANARRELSRYLRYRKGAGMSEPLFATETGERLAYSGLRSLVRRRARQASVEEPCLHSFRRGFALMSLRNGADLVSLQRMLGHSDLTVLRRYLLQTEGDLADVHQRTSPVDRMVRR